MKFIARTKGEVIRLASTSGHIVLVGDEFTEVPKHMESEAFAKGCVSEELYNSIRADLEADAKKASAAISLNGGGTPDGADRSPIIIAKINEMMDSTEDGYFTEAGLPNLRVLGSLCGFRVSKEEMEEAWFAITNSSAPTEGE
jgi:hypothetical protein